MAIEAALLPGGSINTSIAGKAAAAHTHDGADVASGTVPPARLGSGTPTSATVLYGDGQWRASGVGVTAPWQFAPGFPSPVSGDTTPALYASASTTITAFRARRTGGTSATVDVLRNGVSILSAPLVLSTTSWTSGMLVASPNLTTGDTLTVTVSSVTGSVTVVDTSVEGTRPITGGSLIPWQFAPGFQAPVANDAASSYSPVATTVTAFRARRSGGSGAVLDVQRNGVSILTSTLSLTTTAWTAGTLVGSPNLSSGDDVKVVVTSVTGLVSVIDTSVEGTRAAI
jgi:hypothetical protein